MYICLCVGYVIDVGDVWMLLMMMCVSDVGVDVGVDMMMSVMMSEVVVVVLFVIYVCVCVFPLYHV